MKPTVDSKVAEEASALRYMSHAEKTDVFAEIGSIHDRMEVDGLFAMFASERKEHFFYRGIKRASYKLFTTGQRYWMESKGAGGRYRDHHQMYTNRLYHLRNRDDLLFKALFRQWKIDSNDDLALLSLLQHYGCYTPFLDLTEDPFVALYFAAEEPGKAPVPASELDNYFAVYTFPRELVDVVNNQYGEAVKRQSEKGDPNAGRTYSEYRFFQEGYFLVMHQEWIEKHLGDGRGRLINNPYIIRQKGLFAYNSTADLPIPEAFHAVEKEWGLERGKGALVSEQLKCLNIHRSLAPYVRERLAKLDPPIVADYVKPDFKRIFDSMWEEDPKWDE